MRNSKLITILGVVIGTALATSGVAQVSGASGEPTRNLRLSMQSPGKTKETATEPMVEGTQPCGPAAPNSSAGQPSLPSPTMRHKVTLSWNPTAPVTNSSRDTIIGYNVYRKTTAGSSYDDKNKVNSAPLLGTKCVDILVEAGQTYFYVTKAISASGAVSSPSNEVKTVIPDP
jgi:hypothetical protein